MPEVKTIAFDESIAVLSCGVLHETFHQLGRFGGHSSVFFDPILQVYWVLRFTPVFTSKQSEKVMGIMVLSIVAAMILGCVVWLIIGDKFPLKADVKFPPLNNIVIYTLCQLVPTYLLIFFIFN